VTLDVDAFMCYNHRIRTNISVSYREAGIFFNNYEDPYTQSAIENLGTCTINADNSYTIVQFGLKIDGQTWILHVEMTDS
jgi:hypothetical protein